ncbi:MAG TPA: S9 family peptidase [Dongiaceae bacterium]|nr:S9 family peptidase [Dongiaceae bacterium]
MRRLAFLLLSLSLPILGQNRSADDLKAAVSRMARVGRCGSPAFSPDGKTLAVVCDMSGSPQIWTVPVQGGWPTQITAFDDPVGGVSWSPNSDWLAFSISPGGGMNSQVYIAKSDGSSVKKLTAGGKENNWLGDWTLDGSRLTMASNQRSAETMDAYLVNPVPGTTEMIAELKGVGGIEALSRDNRYVVISRLASRGDNNLYLIDRKAGTEQLLTPHTGPGEFSGNISPDGKTVYLVTNKDRDLSAFGRVRIDDAGKPGPIEVVASRDDAELDGFVMNDQGTLGALIWNHAGRNQLALIDLATGRSTDVSDVPAELIGGARFSRDGNKLALVLSGAVTNPNVWVMDVGTQKFAQVTHSPHAGVDFGNLVKPELVTFNSFDGLKLSGWLYRPKNQTGPRPYVISFHGGPEGEELPSFRSDYQALLLAGIGVFAPNVRGSSGFGKKFVNLDNGPLRVNAVKDIKSCVDYLVSNQIADPKRIGITGGSYGGYMTMAGLTEYPDSFAAGADLFGIVNFKTFFEHTEPWMAAISTVEYGDPKTQGDMLDQLSPIYKLDRITAPTMVLHGANDTNVPVIEAEQIVSTLKKRGVPVEYVLFPDEGHGWRKVNNRIRSTVEITQFFSKYLNPETTPGR